MKLRILGSGTSAGVPRIGNDWGTCDPSEPKNRRSRVSIIVESNAGKRILVDTSPDLRNQLLDNDISDLDAVIWTHDHADHCHGIDDLRSIFHYRRVPINGYGRDYTMESLEKRFSYIFEGNKGYPSVVTQNILPDKAEIEGIVVSCVDQPHGPVKSTGLRFQCDGRAIVYATDFHEVTADMIDCYKDCDLLIVDSLRKEPHPTHAHLDLSIELADSCGARRTILTHMDKTMDYQSLTSELPHNIKPGFDGMRVEL